MARLEEKDIIVYSYEASEVLNAEGNRIECGGLDELRGIYDRLQSGKSDEIQYKVDIRFCLDESGKEKMLAEFRSQYPDMKDDDLEQDGGCYATFNVYGDGRCEMIPDGIVMYVNGSGYWLDMDEEDGKVIANAFDRSADLGHRRVEACLLKEIAKAYIDEAVRHEYYRCVKDEEYLKQRFPDLDTLENAKVWSDHNALIELDKAQTDFIEFGLCFEGDNWKDQNIDSPYTIQAFWGDDVIFCSSILKEKYKEEPENDTYERE